MKRIEKLLDLPPFSYDPVEKRRVFSEAMRLAYAFHFTRCASFREWSLKQQFDPERPHDLEQIPFLPVEIFKRINLLSVPEDQIVRTLYSSATTSGVPSKVGIDRITAQRQLRALLSILSSFLGKKRKAFIFFDVPAIATSSFSQLSARAVAIRGLMSAASRSFFCMRLQSDGSLELNLDQLAEAIEQALKSQLDICFYGFTYVVYEYVYPALRHAGIRLETPSAHLLHSGGWKHLSDRQVTKAQFNADVARQFGLPESHVVDFYGMIEQVGTIYPDCEQQRKHTPIFSEILLRDLRTLQVCPPGETGLIQLLTPLPNSYPGISIITDDLGCIDLLDGCPCGRRGIAFRFLGRQEKAEIRGCGDIIAVQQDRL